MQFHRQICLRINYVAISGHVRPRLGPEIRNFGKISPLEFFEFSPVDYLPFSPGFLCNFVRKRPQNVEKIARFPGREKSVESCHVSGCHGFFGPDNFLSNGAAKGGENARLETCLVGKCSATRCSVAAPPPGARHGLGGPMHRDTPRSGREREVRQGPLGGGVAARPLLHTQNCGVSRDRGVATPWSATGGGCSDCPTKARKGQNRAQKCENEHQKVRNWPEHKGDSKARKP